ncbi:proton-conducting transporter transmembrane domain-containing protein [Gordonia sp. NPDC003424]
MDLLPLLPVLVAIVCATATLPSAGPAVVRRWAPVTVSAVTCATGAWLSATLSAPVTALGGQVRADMASAWMLTTIGAVGLVATWAGLGSASADVPPRYAALLCVFVGTMSLAVVVDNLGLLWVSIEATTVATAFLVSHNGTRLALEAAWKYVVLGSVGIVMAFFGIVLIYASSVGGEATLAWTDLSQADGLDPGLLRLGSALAVLGFATKAGLAPMHSWLPDAHGQAPAAVSALMSGVLLSCALYAIIRVQAIADHTLGTGLMRALLATFGAASVALAAGLLWRQRDYKRMLAYSSIEHMGMMAVGAAIGAPALAAVLLYMLMHGLIKAVMFVLSGRILATEQTTAIADLRGLLTRRPRLAVPWLTALVGLLGMPPFGIFLAEMSIVFAGWRAGLGWLVLVVLALLTLVFAALIRITGPMVFGRPSETTAGAEVTGSTTGAGGLQMPIVAALVVCAVLPFIAGPVGSALTEAAAAIGGV